MPNLGGFEVVGELARPVSRLPKGPDWIPSVRDQT
jgi:hypothetical protein